MRIMRDHNPAEITKQEIEEVMEEIPEAREVLGKNSFQWRFSD